MRLETFTMKVGITKYEAKREHKNISQSIIYFSYDTLCRLQIAVVSVLLQEIILYTKQYQYCSLTNLIFTQKMKQARIGNDKVQLKNGSIPLCNARCCLILMLCKYFFISLSHTIPKQRDRNERCAVRGWMRIEEQTMEVTVSAHGKKCCIWCACKWKNSDCGKHDVKRKKGEERKAKSKNPPKTRMEKLWKM